MAISGYSYADAPVSAMEAGVSKYIIKSSIRSPRDYLEPISKALDEFTPSFLGRFNHLHGILASPTERSFWESSVLDALGPDVKQLTSLLQEAIPPFLPILRRRQAESCVQIHTLHGRISSLVWSKALGHAVEFGASRAGLSKPFELPSADAQTLKSGMRGQVNYVIRARQDCVRDQFIEDLSDA